MYGVKTDIDHTKQANEIEDVNERKWLRENATYAVRGLLNFNFHPTVKFLLPEGEPDLEGLAIKREAEDYVLGTEFSHLNAEMKKMYLFYEGGHPQLQQQKRESLWVNLITGLHTEERDDLTKMKDKKLQEKYPITQERSLFPIWRNPFHQGEPTIKDDLLKN